MAIEVTVRNTETGDTETTIVKDYILLVADPYYLADRVAHANGTHVLTLKNATRPAGTVRTQFVAESQESTDA
jgi:hypothetical protein